MENLIDQVTGFLCWLESDGFDDFCPAVQVTLSLRPHICATSNTSKLGLQFHLEVDR